MVCFLMPPGHVNGSLPDSTKPLQSTPIISRLLGAKICERELSGSPVISRKATTSDLQGHRPTYMTYSGVYKSQTVCWAIIEVQYLRFPDLYTHRHHASDKSQQATLVFNNYTTKLSNHMLRKATHDGFCVEISQTTSWLDRKQKCLRAGAAGFTKVAWASRWQIHELYFK